MHKIQVLVLVFLPDGAYECSAVYSKIAVYNPRGQYLTTKKLSDIYLHLKGGIYIAGGQKFIIRK